MDADDKAEIAFEAQCFLMREWTVHDLIRQAPRDLEDRLTEILDAIAARHAGLTQPPEFA
jgi:hypothetical protein